MIVPSIDLMSGGTVQLIGGREKALDAGDPCPIARRFGVVGEVAVIDLDGALGTGSNADLIRELLPMARCRVGGGIRTVQSAIDWLDAGAPKIIIGTAASPELLRELPRDRVLVALDADRGEVVIEGWRKRTGRTILDRIAELREFVGGFLVTFVEREGRMTGTNLDQVAAIVKAAAPARVTIAGGVTTTEEIASLDRLGADAQVGMALYTGRLSLADAFASPLVSDRRDSLWPTVIVDELDAALGLAYSSPGSLRAAIDSGRGVYHSRARGMWTKGESSGDTQDLLRIDADCDRDTLRFTVRQRGRGFCHRGTRTCWDHDKGIGALCRRIAAQIAADVPGSYSARLARDPALLAAKLVEEAGELGQAQTPIEVIHEAADVVFFTSAAMARAGVSIGDVAAELDRRSLRLTRRPGLAKPGVEARS